LSTREEHVYNITLPNVEAAPEVPPEAGTSVTTTTAEVFAPVVTEAVPTPAPTTKGVTYTTTTKAARDYTDEVPVEILAEQIANLLYLFKISGITIYLKPRDTPPTSTGGE
jgi:hypothetical protein